MGGDGDKCGVAVLGLGARESGWLANAGRPARFAVSMAARRPRAFGVILEARRRPMRFVVPVDTWRSGGVPCAICDVHGCAAPADAQHDPRCPRMHGTQSAQCDSWQLKYALWWLLV